jgi:hypothetical protein
MQFFIFSVGKSKRSVTFGWSQGDFENWMENGNIAMPVLEFGPRPSGMQ